MRVLDKLRKKAKGKLKISKKGPLKNVAKRRQERDNAMKNLFPVNKKK